MEIEPLDTLTRQHTTTSLFGPLGLSLGGPILTPEASLRWVQEMIAGYDLDERVPEEVRGYYEVSRRLHVYGFFEYRFFTTANERATFAAEFAVRQRLLDCYASHVPIERGTGSAHETATIESADTWDFESRFRRKWRGKWRLVGFPDFDGSFGAHLKWSRMALDLGQYFGPVQNPLTGEESPGRLDALRQLRNLAAHPSMDTIVSPVDSARSVEFSWKFINALWGTPAAEAFH